MEKSSNFDIGEFASKLDRTSLSIDALETDLKNVYRTGRPFVGIEQFLFDDDYMGKIAQDLYPNNIPDLLDIFDPKRNYIEVIFTGATSIGKTFMTALALTYMIGQIGNFTDPHRWLGGSPASPIVFINMSITAQKAKEVIFNRVKTMIDSSPYFREVFPRDYRLGDSLLWYLSSDPKEVAERTGPQLMFKPGTGDSLSALGDDIYAGAGDELNFFRVVAQSTRTHGEALDPAQRLYDVISRRMKGRFSSGGKALGKFFLLSSAQYPEDFVERRIKEAQQAGELGDTVKLVRKSVWEAQAHVFVQGKPKYAGPTFRVEVGSDRRGSRLLDRYDKQTGTVTVGEQNDIEGKILEVPIEWYDEFRRDVEGSVRDLGGEVTRAIRPFFEDTEIIFRACDLGQAEGLVHPWSRDETTMEDGSVPKFDLLFKHDEKENRWRPLRHPTANRYAHVDLATTGDSAGLAIVHIAGWKTVMREGKQSVEPVYETDLLLRINPHQGGEIRFSKIRSIFYMLRGYGMSFRKITYDSWQSTDSLQELESRGFRADTLSVDRDISPYVQLKDAMADGRVRMYFYERAVTELSRLERKVDKVDHPANGSKDVSDALAGAVWGAFTSEAALSPGDLEARLPNVQHKANPFVDPQKEQKAKDLVDAEEEMRQFMGGNRSVRR